jgi:hypothetical protein
MDYKLINWTFCIQALTIQAEGGSGLKADG